MAQPQRPGGFDMNRASTGSKIVLGAAIVLLITLFLPWAGANVDLGAFGEAFDVDTSFSAFQVSGLTILLVLVLIALIAWEIMMMAGMRLNLGTMSPGLLSAILAGVAVLLGLIIFLQSLGAISWGAFIGLLAILALAYGAYMRFTESRTTAPPPPRA
jgi:hypothetical protein